MKKPIFIAHRGAPTPSRRENSLAAFKRAKESNRFEFIEFDVRRTRSDDSGQRIPIVAHDATTDRLYDLQRIPQYKRTYAGVELASLTHAMLQADSLEVNTLAETLRALNGHKVNVEIKDITALPEILEIINDFVEQTSSKWRLSDFIISSLDPQVILKAKEQYPEIRVAVLYGYQNLLSWPVGTFKQTKAENIHVTKWLAPIFVPLFVLFGIKNRYTYTVNTKLGVKFLQLFGVNGFFTDSITLPESF